MAESPTTEEILEAARSLGGEFTRDDVAQKLGVERQELREPWRQLKQAGQLEKVGENAQGANLFKVSA